MIAAWRLHSSFLADNPLDDPREVVRRLLAVQAQDYPSAAWAIAQRTRAATATDVDDLFNAGAILRTHVLRPTWHFVMPADIRWLLRLTGPRVKRVMAYYDRTLGIDADLVGRGRAALHSVLGDRGPLPRAEIGQALRRGGLDVDNQLLGHLLMHAELDAVICSGPRRGRQLTYALLDDVVPATTMPEPDVALAELITRYLAGHGPAQVRDLAWWSGLTITQVRRGVELAGPALTRTTVDGRLYLATSEARPESPSRRPLVHLLPSWDEYTVGYADRSDHVGPALRASPPTSAELLSSSVMIDGRFAGGWRRTLGAADATVTVRCRVHLSTSQRAGLRRAADRYGRFLGRPVSLVEEPAEGR